MRTLTICSGVLFLAAIGFAVQTRGGQAAPSGQAASTGDAQAAPKGNVENGKKIFVSYGCYECHGYMAQGGGAGPHLAPNPILFEAFMHQLRNPRDDMPPYSAKLVSDQDAADIYAYLKTIPAPPPLNSIPLLKKP